MCVCVCVIHIIQILVLEMLILVQMNGDVTTFWYPVKLCMPVL